MRRVIAVAGLLALLGILLPPTAHAGTVPPVVEIERAWAVQKGAALQVAYTITCPDPADRGYHHAMVTNGDYLEFRCSPEPTRVVQLLDGPVSKGGRVTVDTEVLSPQCMYADYNDPDFVIPGCHVVERTDVLRMKGGRFEAESAAGRGGTVTVTKVRAVRDGGVRIVARFACQRPLDGWVPFQVSQVTRTGFTSAGDGGADRYVDCTPGEPRKLRWVARPSESDPPFAVGRRVVVTLEWAKHYEGGQWAYHSGLHKVVRPRSAPPS
jgi:hypothetical protein